MRIYYGWYIVVIALLMITLTIGSTFLSFGLFVIPAGEDFQLSRANMNTALIALSFGSAVVSPFVGRILDVVPIRRVMAVCALLFGGSFVALGFSRSIWLSVAIIAVPLAVGFAGVGALATNTLVARWFTAYRGRAMAILAVGLSLGGVVIVPAVGLTMEAVGWRNTLIVMGVALVAILLLLVSFIRERPGPDDSETSRPQAQVSNTAGAEVSTAPCKVSDLIRIPHYWLICLSAAISLAVIQSIAITIVPLAQDGGMSASVAASILSFYGMAAITGKLLLAGIVDRIEKMVLVSVLYVVVAMACGVFLIGDGYHFLLLSCVLVGLTSGATPPTYFAILAERFGPSSFGTAHGLAAPIIAIIGAASMRFAGEVHDRTGSYDLLFATFIVVLVGAAAMMLGARIQVRRHALRSRAEEQAPD